MTVHQPEVMGGPSGFPKTAIAMQAPAIIIIYHSVKQGISSAIITIIIIVVIMIIIFIVIIVVIKIASVSLCSPCPWSLVYWSYHSCGFLKMKTQGWCSSRSRDRSHSFFPICTSVILRDKQTRLEWGSVNFLKGFCCQLMLITKMCFIVHQNSKKLNPAHVEGCKMHIYAICIYM